MPLLEAHQQDLRGVHANLLFETVIETLDADTIVHFQAQMMISSGDLAAVKNVYAAIPEQSRWLQY